MPKAPAFWLAVAGTSVLSLAGLNVVADKFPHTGVATLRDFLVRRNG